MFSFSPSAAPQPNSSSSVLWTNMESNKVMCPTFSVMLVRTIKALCEINVRFDHKLEISGSLHVRSDGDKVMTCLIDEESIKGAQDLSILDAVRFTMPYAAAALAPMAIPGGFGQQPGQLPDALMSPIPHVTQQAVQPSSIPAAGTEKDKHVNNNGTSLGGQSRHEMRDQSVAPHVVNIVPSEPERVEVPQSHQVDMSNITLVNSKPPELQLAEAEAALLLHRRLSNENATRPNPDVVMATSHGHKLDTSRHAGHSTKTGGRAKSNHSSLTPSNTATTSNTTSQVHLQGQNMATSATSVAPTTVPPVQAQASAQQNHVKLPNIQTFAGMLPRLPQIKTESKDSVSPLPRSSEPPSFPSPPQNLASSPMSGSFAVDPLVGVKIEVQSQVDAEGNIVQKKKFQCMFCGIFLSTKCYLKNHINAMHTKARVYPCEVCEKYFYSAGALRIHKLRNHWQGSKKHKCDHCGETFLLPIELRKHVMKKHSELEDAYEGTGPGSSGGASISNMQARTPVDHNTAPSSASSSPRVLVEKPIFPSSFAHSLSPGAMHGTPVFPGHLPHSTTAAIHKELVAAAAAAVAMEAATDVSVTHSNPVFPSPIPQSLVHPAGTGHKTAINSSVSETTTE